MDKREDVISFDEPAAEPPDDEGFSYGTKHLFIAIADPLPLTTEQVVVVALVDGMRCACFPQLIKRTLVFFPFFFLSVWAASVTAATWDDAGCDDVHEWLLLTVALLLLWPLLASPLIFCTNDFDNAAHEAAHTRQKAVETAEASAEATAKSTKTTTTATTAIMSGARVRLGVICVLSLLSVIAGAIGEGIVAGALQDHHEAGNSTATTTTTTAAIGAPHDDVEHGCLTDGGFVYCERLDECVRPWEIECDDPDVAVDPVTMTYKNFTAYAPPRRRDRCSSERLVDTARSVAFIALLL